MVQTDYEEHSSTVTDGGHIVEIRIFFDEEEFFGIYLRLYELAEEFNPTSSYTPKASWFNSIFPTETDLDAAEAWVRDALGPEQTDSLVVQTSEKLSDMVTHVLKNHLGHDHCADEEPNG